MNGKLFCEIHVLRNDGYWGQRRMANEDSVVIWLIECRTGCTCCSNENHYRGAYRTKADADRRIAYFLSKDSKYWPLASQYLRRGGYVVSRKEAEPISGGRFIVDDKVLRGITFVDVAEDGTVKDNDSERFELD